VMTENNFPTDPAFLTTPSANICPEVVPFFGLGFMSTARRSGDQGEMDCWLLVLHHLPVAQKLRRRQATLTANRESASGQVATSATLAHSS